MTATSVHPHELPAEVSRSLTGRIGPNALIQTIEVLRSRFGEDEARQVLSSATGRAMTALPDMMVLEHEANALMAEVRRRYGKHMAAHLLHESGERTADYLLANRIPRLAQRVIQLLPRSVGTRVLLSAVSRHAWTFAGSGKFSYIVGSPITLRFANCALCRGRSEPAPACEYYAATFEALFRKLVDPRARVREVECCAAGGSVCRFIMERG